MLVCKPGDVIEVTSWNKLRQYEEASSHVVRRWERVGLHVYKLSLFDDISKDYPYILVTTNAWNKRYPLYRKHISHSIYNKLKD